MKRSIFLIFITLVFTSVLNAQNVENADFISPVHEDMIAVKKGSQWGFMDAEGKMVIDFREDLVVSKTEDGNFPIFHNGRCLMTQKKEGIPYFGYIDTSGKTIIEPLYLNATNFKDERAVVLLLQRTVLAQNALNKQVVNYGYFEVVINLSGDMVKNLFEDPVTITLTADNLKRAPSVNSKVLSKTLVAVMNAQKKWTVVKLD